MPNRSFAPLRVKYVGHDHGTKGLSSLNIYIIINGLWKEWDARLLIELSLAIKSPTVQVHLVGAKIVQQKLFETGSVERFIKNNEIAKKIRATFVELLAINVKKCAWFFLFYSKFHLKCISTILLTKNDTLQNVIDLINKSSEEYVLKPQREGGGHNIYKEDIRLDESHLEKYLEI